MRALFSRLIADEDGQDLVEYALLTSFVAFASIAGLNAITSAVQAAYGIFENAMNSLWESPPPA